MSQTFLHEPVTLQLRYPVSADGAELATLTLRRPKVRDLLAAETAGGSPAEKEIRLFAHLCETPPAVIEAMDLADYQRLQEAYQGFLEPGSA